MIPRSRGSVDSSEILSQFDRLILVLFKNQLFPLRLFFVFDGLLKRRIPGKNGEAAPRTIFDYGSFKGAPGSYQHTLQGIIPTDNTRVPQTKIEPCQVQNKLGKLGSRRICFRSALTNSAGLDFLAGGKLLRDTAPICRRERELRLSLWPQGHGKAGAATVRARDLARAGQKKSKPSGCGSENFDRDKPQVLVFARVQTNLDPDF